MIKVLITDDHKMVREGLAALIEAMQGFEVIGEAEDGLECLRKMMALEPDILLLDIDMPKQNGMETLKQIVAKKLPTRVLMLSFHNEASIVKHCLRSGAMGYLDKGLGREELELAMRRALNGEQFVTENVRANVGAVKELQSEESDQSALLAELSERETEILRLIAQGLSTKEIADQLHISPRTAETHRFNMMKKLDIHKVSGLIRFALKAGIS